MATAAERRVTAGKLATKSRDRKLTRPAAEGEALRPHQRAYAAWLATQFTPPKVADKKKVVAQYAKVPHQRISSAYIRALEDRADFQELVHTLESSYVEQARSTIDRSLVKGATVYEGALDEAARRLRDAPEDFDLRMVAGLVTPALERASPRKADGPATAVQVNIALSPSQAALLADPLPSVDYEIVNPAE